MFHATIAADATDIEILIPETGGELIIIGAGTQADGNNLLHVVSPLRVPTSDRVTVIADGAYRAVVEGLGT